MATRLLEMGGNLLIRIYKMTIGNYSSINAEYFAIYTYIYIDVVYTKNALAKAAATRLDA